MNPLELNSREQRLFELIRPEYDHDDPGHDLAHISRVLKSCREIGAAEKADLTVLMPAAMLHDVVNLPKDHPLRKEASAMAARKSRQLLEAAGYSAPEIEAIGGVIVEHSYSLGQKPSTPESAVLQDADRLDALGAIGIMRTVSCGCKIGGRYYDPKEPFARERDLDDKKFMIDHFFVKLFKLPELMNTAAGRAEADKRARFMREFLVQLGSELDPG